MVDLYFYGLKSADWTNWKQLNLDNRFKLPQLQRHQNRLKPDISLEKAWLWFFNEMWTKDLKFRGGYWHKLIERFIE